MSALEEIVYGLGRLAGLRCAEITGVRRMHVALADDLLRVHGTKSAESVRPVIVFPELAEIIERWLDHQTHVGSAPNTATSSRARAASVCRRRTRGDA
jgi:site-specific recombinase XerC